MTIEMSAPAIASQLAEHLADEADRRNIGIESVSITVTTASVGFVPGITMKVAVKREDADEMQGYRTHFDPTDLDGAVYGSMLYRQCEEHSNALLAGDPDSPGRASAGS